MEHMAECEICGSDVPPNMAVQMNEISGLTMTLRQVLAEQFNDINDGEDVGHLQDNSWLCHNCVMRARRCLSAEGDIKDGLMKVVISNHTQCVICHQTARDVGGPNGRFRQPDTECRVNVFLETGKMLRENAKICPEHCTSDGYILRPFLGFLRAVTSPFQLEGNELSNFLLHTRAHYRFAKEVRVRNCFTWKTEDFKILTGVTQQQFHEIASDVYGEARTECQQTNVLMVLMKISHNISDSRLGVEFNIPRTSISRRLEETVQLFMDNFVPRYLGLHIITREECVARHNTDFVRELLNIPVRSEPEPVVVCMDTTYLYMQKSTNFSVLRQTFSNHKRLHLSKPSVMVATDGYILCVHGPYYADHPNNDSSILANIHERDTEFRNWFAGRAIMFADRGFRDIADELRRDYGIDVRHPPFLAPGQVKFTTKQANEIKMVTKVRWIVEAVFGILKKRFKILQSVVQMHNMRRIGKYFRIACAIYNKWHHPTLLTDDIVMARDMRDAHIPEDIPEDELAEPANALQTLVEENNWVNNMHQWLPIADLQEELEDFPTLGLQEIRYLAKGGFQLKLCRSYIDDAVRHSMLDDVEARILRPGIVKIRLRSRYSNAGRHSCFIHFSTEGEVPTQLNNFCIRGMYCTCKAGSRTIGTCAHCCSSVYLLAYARHHDQTNPPDFVLDVLVDAAV